MPPEDTEDRQIIHQCLNGDTAMFGFLVDKYKEAVYHLAYSKLGNFHDAQDIAQEAFIKAYRKLRTLRHWDKFALWLAAITNNLCKNFIRARANRPDREFAEDQSREIIDHTSVDSYRESLEYEPLKEALSSLPEIYRQVLVLHYLSGYRSVDIAHFLGISIRTVAERLRVGRERLREEMVVMMSRTYEQYRLPAGFTFHIMEAVKRVKIQPMPRTAGLPWGLSLATGIIIAILSIGSHLSLPNFIYPSLDSLPPGETAMTESGEMPVDILKLSRTPVTSIRQADGDSMRAQFFEGFLQVDLAPVHLPVDFLFQCFSDVDACDAAIQPGPFPSASLEGDDLPIQEFSQGLCFAKGLCLAADFCLLMFLCLLHRPRSGKHGEIPGYEVVAGVPVRDFFDLTNSTQSLYIPK